MARTDRPETGRLSPIGDIADCSRFSLTCQRLGMSTRTERFYWRQGRGGVEEAGGLREKASPKLGIEDVQPPGYALPRSLFSQHEYQKAKQ